MSDVAPEVSDRGRRTAIFSRSYEGAISRGRHTDEKLRSLLGAIAFLTAAGVTLFTFAARFSGPPSSAAGANGKILAVSPATAGDIVFALFMLGIFLSISSALVALTPDSHAPGFLL